MSTDEWRLVLTVVNLLASCLVGIYVWFVNRHQVTVKRIDELERIFDARADCHAERLTRLEGDVKHMPKQADLTTLNHSISKTNDRLSTIEGRLTGIGRAVDLVNQHLINGGKR